MLAAAPFKVDILGQTYLFLAVQIRQQIGYILVLCPVRGLANCGLRRVASQQGLFISIS